MKTNTGNWRTEHFLFWRLEQDWFRLMGCRAVIIIFLRGMMETYVEGVHGDIMEAFEERIIKASKHDEDGYQLTDAINDMSRFSISRIGTAFAECIEQMFDIDTYGLSREKQKELRKDLYKWINDTGYKQPSKRLNLKG